jgi:hypothetical protein
VGWWLLGAGVTPESPGVTSSTFATFWVTVGRLVHGLWRWRAVRVAGVFVSFALAGWGAVGSYFAREALATVALVQRHTPSW